MTEAPRRRMKTVHAALAAGAGLCGTASYAGWLGFLLLQQDWAFTVTDWLSRHATLAMVAALAQLVILLVVRRLARTRIVELLLGLFLALQCLTALAFLWQGALRLSYEGPRLVLVSLQWASILAFLAATAVGVSLGRLWCVWTLVAYLCLLTATARFPVPRNGPGYRAMLQQVRVAESLGRKAADAADTVVTIHRLDGPEHYALCAVLFVYLVVRWRRERRPRQGPTGQAA